LEKVDPIFFEKAYYLGPDKGGDRPYKLLRAALEQTQRAALAKYAARGKQYLVLVRPKDDGLVMQQLRYADEIRSMRDIPLGEGEVSDDELKLAMQLVEQIATDEFNPGAYEDEVKGRIEAAISAKVEGQEIAEEPGEEPAAKIIDLMDALKASLGESSEKKPAKRAPRKKAAKKKAAEG
ncbi:MAG: non-homologous end joining protein Ku, partial [Planctomycetota bacterium]